MSPSTLPGTQIFILEDHEQSEMKEEGIRFRDETMQEYEKGTNSEFCLFIIQCFFFWVGRFLEGSRYGQESKKKVETETEANRLNAEEET